MSHFILFPSQDAIRQIENVFQINNRICLWSISCLTVNNYKRLSLFEKSHPLFTRWKIFPVCFLSRWICSVLLQLWQMVSAALSFHHPLPFHTVSQTALLSLSFLPPHWGRSKDGLSCDMYRGSEKEREAHGLSRSQACLTLRCLPPQANLVQYTRVHMRQPIISTVLGWIFICNRLIFASITLKARVLYCTVLYTPIQSCCSSVLYHSTHRDILLLVVAHIYFKFWTTLKVRFPTSFDVTQKCFNSD